MSASETRDRILDAATELFYQEGINKVGIDTVIARAKIAKMTLYAHFKSKNDLILAFLERMNLRWGTWYSGRLQALAPDPRKRPLALFDALEEWFRRPDFRGCPFINTAAEVSDPNHPAHRAARAYKEGLLELIRKVVREAGLRDPKGLSEQLLLLVDGAVVRAGMTGDPGAARTARKAAAALLSRGR